MSSETCACDMITGIVTSVEGLLSHPLSVSVSVYVTLQCVHVSHNVIAVEGTLQR